VGDVRCELHECRIVIPANTASLAIVTAVVVAMDVASDPATFK
jgi:hypothetical protein